MLTSVKQLCCPRLGIIYHGASQPSRKGRIDCTCYVPRQGGGVPIGAMGSAALAPPVRRPRCEEYTAGGPSETGSGGSMSRIKVVVRKRPPALPQSRVDGRACVRLGCVLKEKGFFIVVVFSWFFSFCAQIRVHPGLLEQAFK
jgi:hypothetical protein